MGIFVDGGSKCGDGFKYSGNWEGWLEDGEWDDNGDWKDYDDDDDDVDDDDDDDDDDDYGDSG